MEITAIFRMLVGLPASGKSTYAKNLTNFKVISSDAIREEVFDGAEDQTHNNEVFEIMFERTKAALLAGKNCVYDATNLSSKRRIALLKRFKTIKELKNITYECVVSALIYGKCLEFNKKRERVVPEYAMLRMYKSFEPPHKSEGWDKISIINKDGGTTEDLTSFVYYFLCGIPHDNHHHSLTIGEHITTAFRYYYDTCTEIDVDIAAAILFHDIGKLITKDFHNAKGELTEEAHYYNHNNVGAYLFLSNSQNWEDDEEVLEVANLIFHHMDFFKEEKYLEKIKERYGEEFFNKLQIIHEADMFAH